MLRANFLMNEESQPANLVTVITFGLVIAAIIGAGVLLAVTQPEPVAITINPPLPTETPRPTTTPAPITVYVTGAVTEPESLVALPPNSRVQDAIAAAGGVVDTADLERVNLADILRDGDQVHVPSVAQVAVIEDEVGGGIVEVEDDVGEALELATPTRPEVVYVNSATLEELTTLPRIGETTAQRIIDYREANGAFADLEALGNVQGIGDATLAGLADRVAFD